MLDLGLEHLDVDVHGVASEGVGIIFAFARSSPGFDRHWSPSVLDILPLQWTPRSGCPNEHALVTTFNSDPGMCP